MTVTSTPNTTTELADIYPERYQEVKEYQAWSQTYNRAERAYGDAVNDWATRPITQAEYAAAFGYADWDEYCETSNADKEEDTCPTTIALENPYWGAHKPYSEQVTLALRIGYYEGLLTNRVDGKRFETSSYYRLGQILGTAARDGKLPHDSYKAIVWAVDDETGFRETLPLGKESYKLANQIIKTITNE